MQQRELKYHIDHITKGKALNIDRQHGSRSQFLLILYIQNKIKHEKYNLRASINPKIIVSFGLQFALTMPILYVLINIQFFV